MKYHHFAFLSLLLWNVSFGLGWIIHGSSSSSRKKNHFHFDWPTFSYTRPPSRTSTLPMALLAMTNQDSSSSSSSALMIVGLGRVGQSIASYAEGHFDLIVGATSRNTKNLPDMPSNLKQISLSELYSFLKSRQSSNNRSDEENLLENCCHILVTIPGTVSEFNLNNTTVSASELYDTLVKQLLSTTRNNSWVGVLSTTAVYGNHNGEWVTEDSECRVTSSEEESVHDSSPWQWLEYENAWKQRCKEMHNDHHHFDLCLFRCAGIYGPTRSALHTLYKQNIWSKMGTIFDDDTSPLITKTDTRSVVTNRIHETDIARAVIASMLQWSSAVSVPDAQDDHDHDDNSKSQRQVVEIYNLADNLPECRQVVMTYASNLLTSKCGLLPNDKDREPQDEANSSSKRQSSFMRSTRRGRDAKRVDNTKMKHKLLQGSSLVYPTYKEGLQSILQDPLAPWNNNNNSSSSGN